MFLSFYLFFIIRIYLFVYLRHEFHYIPFQFLSSAHGTTALQSSIICSVTNPFNGFQLDFFPCTPKQKSFHVAYFSKIHNA